MKQAAQKYYYETQSLFQSKKEAQAFNGNKRRTITVTFQSFSINSTVTVSFINTAGHLL